MLVCLLQWNHGNQWKNEQNKMSKSQQISKIFKIFLQMSVQQWNAYNFNFLYLVTFCWPLPQYFYMVITQAFYQCQMHLNDRELLQKVWNFTFYVWKTGKYDSMEIAIEILKSPNIEVVTYHPTWKGNKFCKQSFDLWACNLLYHLINEVKRNIQILFIIPLIRL